MKLFPAIDILGGRAVRLLRGEKSAVTDYGAPQDMAKRWIDEGASYLHVVDLDGAFGSGRNLSVISAIAKLSPVQVGGGIRGEAEIRELLDAGAARVILGTRAALDPDFAGEMIAKHGKAIACGIDCKDGFVAVKGWTAKTDLTAEALGKRLKALGAEVVIYTDISRDGALSGVNASATAELSNATGLSVIASGGMRDLADIETLKKSNVYGAILGKSLYEGTIRLREAICLEDESSPA